VGESQEQIIVFTQCIHPLSGLVSNATRDVADAAGAGERLALIETIGGGKTGQRQQRDGKDGIQYGWVFFHQVRPLLDIRGGMLRVLHIFKPLFVL
jgi:N-methylhydantoinase B/oxoprolinase/acetone carboxylase alpha subunit